MKMSYRNVINYLRETLPFLRRGGAVDWNNIDRECGYPDRVDVLQYEQLFNRGDLAQRVVNLWPAECWSDAPEIYEQEEEEATAFEEAWKDLLDRLHPFAVLYRADVLSGIGNYGIILLGFADGQPLDQPAQYTNKPLLYLRPFGGSGLQITEYDTNPASPRYGQPKAYRITVRTNEGSGNQLQETSLNVHWSRIIHLADNRMDSDIFGQPRMEPVFNRLLDIRKIASGSAEMYWKGGFPGLAIEAMPSVPGEVVEIDEQATQKQVEEYQQGLTRYLALVGAQAKTLSPNISDPTATLQVQLRLVATALGVPWRVLIGSEQAQLASEQDAKAWARRVQRRRIDYLVPYVVRPFLDRLIEYGALPEPADGYLLDWPRLDEMEGQEKAGLAATQTTAMAQYVAGGVDQLIPPFQYLTTVLGFSDEEARAMLDEVKEQAEEEDNLPETSEMDKEEKPEGDKPAND